MMNRFLRNKTGVTILEGLIALGLLALVAAGTFGVLLSVSRKAGSPDLREEMIWAVERANEQLQMYPPGLEISENVQLPDELKYGLCGGDNNPLAINATHNINCMLPAICDRNTSSFSYTTGIQKVNMDIKNPSYVGYAYGTVRDWNNSPLITLRSVEFSITCNGFTL